ncbi:p53-like transcription factor like protein [Zymoseptoria brevis]|uniref:p53-like transcription factor like protein n=1 Tax=Zymoseptoria brevis TaxID=1047168 RepID=A0A0F4G4B0_9PEZI|nr:p53-like transcription factor like protein [Zymoseptoria brevis]
MVSVLTMEQGPILQQHHQLPLHDYSLSSDHDYNDQFSPHTHHSSSYTPGAAVDHRRDATTQLQAPAAYSFTPSNGTPSARFVSDRIVASENSSYHTNNFTDSSSGSISSPSSAASSLAYTTYQQQNPCTNISTYTNPVPLHQSYTGTYASTRVPSIADSLGPGMLPPPNPIRSPITSSSHTLDRDSYPHSSPFLARPLQSPGSQSGYGSYTDTPRSSLTFGSLPLSNALPHSYSNPHAHMASPPGYSSHHSSNECINFPWPTLEIQAEIQCDGASVTPEVHAKVEKGFFPSTVDQKWTCYRRNYFSVQCSFELHPNINGGRMFLKRSKSTNTEPIQAMGMRLSAAVDGQHGKNIELVQHTPKRDNGPKTKIDIIKVSPMPTSGRNEHTVSPHGVYQVPMPTFHATGQVPGPYLPLQNVADPNAAPSSTTPTMSSQFAYAASTQSPQPGQTCSHTFERVQFKQATANNGKRRASQQYFHLVVELFADVCKENSDTPNWVKVAHRVSEKIVVRGRSPSHYQNEGQHQNGRTGSSGGSSGYSTTAGASYGSLTAGGFRTGSTGYGGSLGGGSYRTNNAYAFHPSPENSGSSSSSVDGGANDADYPPDTVMTESERNEVQSQEGYRYYPGSIYEGNPPHHASLPIPKLESSARFNLSSEPSQWAVKAEYSDSTSHAPSWPTTLSRFQGVDSSRGYFPDLAANNYS